MPHPGSEEAESAFSASEKECAASSLSKGIISKNNILTKNKGELGRRGVTNASHWVLVVCVQPRHTQAKEV